VLDPDEPASRPPGRNRLPWQHKQPLLLATPAEFPRGPVPSPGNPASRGHPDRSRHLPRPANRGAWTEGRPLPPIERFHDDERDQLEKGPRRRHWDNPPPGRRLPDLPVAGRGWGRPI